MNYFCTNCGQELDPCERHPAISWQISPRDWFCDYDCRIDYMAKNDIRFVNPEPQPDVTDAQ